MIDLDIRTRLLAGNDVSDPIRSPGAVLTDTVAFCCPVGNGGVKI